MSLSAEANPFRVSVETGRIHVRSIGTKATYAIEAYAGYGYGQPGRSIRGPAFLAPDEDWSFTSPDRDETRGEFSITFCDESGVPGHVFAATGYVQQPAITIPRRILSHQAISELTPSLSNRRLFWRDRRDLDPNSATLQCAEPPALHQTTIENQGSEVSAIDVQPISGVIQLLAEDAVGQPVAQILTITAPPGPEATPLWVRQPLIWYLVGILSSALALLLGLGKGSSGRA